MADLKISLEFPLKLPYKWKGNGTEGKGTEQQQPHKWESLQAKIVLEYFEKEPPLCPQMRDSQNVGMMTISWITNCKAVAIIALTLVLLLESNYIIIIYHHKMTHYTSHMHVISSLSWDFLPP